MAKAALESYIQGLLDAVSLHRAYSAFAKSSEILVATAKLMATNLVLILGSELLLTRGLLPLSHAYGAWLYAAAGSSYELSDSWLEATVDLSIKLLYYVTWLAPIWGLVWTTNLSAYSEIASKAYTLGGNKPVAQKIEEVAQETMYHKIFFVVLLLQKYAVQLVPFVGRYAGFAFSLLLASLYAFEYAWSMQGVPISKRLSYIEHNWAYFAGFGTPTVMATFFLPLFVSLAVYASIFPFCILLATNSAAITSAHAAHQRCLRVDVPKLPAFQPTYTGVNRVLRWVERNFGVSASRMRAWR